MEHFETFEHCLLIFEFCDKKENSGKQTVKM